jgi:hypothetical protein
VIRDSRTCRNKLRFAKKTKLEISPQPKIFNRKDSQSQVKTDLGWGGSGRGVSVFLE